MLFPRLMGMFALIPATILLTVSFFVLFAIRKSETAGIKAFGYVVAGLLWAGALMVFSLGVYTISTGRHPVMPCMMAGKMSMMSPDKGCGKMQQGMMMREKMHEAMPDKMDK